MYSDMPLLYSCWWPGTEAWWWISLY